MKKSLARSASSGFPSLPSNLRYLCGFYPSVSIVCRRIGINRQQFGKYLSGTAVPSLFTLNKISDFFGLDSSEMCLPHVEMRRIFNGRPSAAQEDEDQSTPSTVRHRIFNEVALFIDANAAVLRRYEGRYFRYNYAFDGSGRVVRSLFHIRYADGVCLTRLIERIQHRSNEPGKLTTLKYDGVLVALSGCLFNIEFERLMRSCVGHAAFPTLPRPGQRFMTGIQSSISSSTGRPTASRVVLERITRPMRTRELLRMCGTFAAADGLIEPDVLDLIGNQVRKKSDLFCAYNV